MRPNVALRYAIMALRVKCDKGDDGDKCPWSGKLEDRAAHHANDCTHQTVECTFKPFGCTVCPQRRHLGAHNAEYAQRHCQMALADCARLQADLEQECAARAAAEAKVAALEAAAPAPRLRDRYERERQEREAGGAAEAAPAPAPAEKATAAPANAEPVVDEFGRVRRPE